MRNIIVVFSLAFIVVASVKGDEPEADGIGLRAWPETSPSPLTTQALEKTPCAKSATTTGLPLTTTPPTVHDVTTKPDRKGKDTVQMTTTEKSTPRCRKVKPKQNWLLTKFKKPSKSPDMQNTDALLESIFKDALEQIKDQMNNRRSLEPSIPSEWFRKTIKQLSDAKRGHETNLIKIPDMVSTQFYAEPKNVTSETFNQSLRVLDHSGLLMKISDILKTIATRRGNQEQIAKEADRINKIAVHKRNSAFALMKTDLPRNLQALKRAEHEATNRLQMLRILSSGAWKRAADIPKESVQLDVMKTEENAVEVSKHLVEYLAKALSENETVNVSEIVDAMSTL